MRFKGATAASTALVGEGGLEPPLGIGALAAARRSVRKRSSLAPCLPGSRPTALYVCGGVLFARRQSPFFSVDPLLASPHPSRGWFRADVQPARAIHAPESCAYPLRAPRSRPLGIPQDEVLVEVEGLQPCLGSAAPVPPRRVTEGAAPLGTSCCPTAHADASLTHRQLVVASTGLRIVPPGLLYTHPKFLSFDRQLRWKIRDSNPRLTTPWCRHVHPNRTNLPCGRLTRQSSASLRAPPPDCVGTFPGRTPVWSAACSEEGL